MQYDNSNKKCCQHNMRPCAYVIEFIGWL